MKVKTQQPHFHLMIKDSLKPCSEENFKDGKTRESEMTYDREN